jgi:hypothetical protein
LTSRELLCEATLKKEWIDRFLDPKVPKWALFDSTLGYVLHTSTMQDGMDNSFSLYRYPPSGERLMINYADHDCRINTYGDSFTQCHQVSDGETWQEILAAHIGEPIRNFGVGGYGVYQAYRRMLREEATKHSAPYIILNIYDDDHRRRMHTWRWLHIRGFRTKFESRYEGPSRISFFHGNPWAHLKFNTTTGKFEEQDNPYPTPESLYRLCDKEHVYEAFRDKLDVQLSLAMDHAVDVDTARLKRVADMLEIPVDFSSPTNTAQTASELLDVISQRSSMYVVDKAASFAETNGKKLMILLSYSNGSVMNACKGKKRFDEVFLDYLRKKQVRFVDTLSSHVKDFEVFKCSPCDYAKRYYIPVRGHYNPLGNTFFAFAIKDSLVNWLNPKPPAYQPRGFDIKQFIDPLRKDGNL